MNKSLTIKRNKQIVGNNSKSYNDKHPDNPVSLRPIHDALRANAAKPKWFIRKIRAMRNWSKPQIARGLALL